MTTAAAEKVTVESEIINGFAITGEAVKKGRKTFFPFACAECGKEIGLREKAKVKIRKTLCKCLRERGEKEVIKDTDPKFVKKDDDGCVTICHIGVSEMWHQLVTEEGMSQRKAAERVHSLIMSKTNNGEELEENITPEKVRNTARKNTGKGRKSKGTTSSPKPKTGKDERSGADTQEKLSNITPTKLVESVRSSRQSIETQLTEFSRMANNGGFEDDSCFKQLKNEISALKALVDTFLGL